MSSQGLIAQHIHAFGWGELETGSRQIWIVVQATEADGGVVTKTVTQLHACQLVAFETDADVLIARIG